MHRPTSGADSRRQLADNFTFAGIFDRQAPALLSYLVPRVSRDEAENLLGELSRELRASTSKVSPKNTEQLANS